MPFRQEPGRRRVTVNLDVELVDWVDAELDGHPSGREVIVDRALRELRRIVERDRANPRPPA